MVSTRLANMMLGAWMRMSSIVIPASQSPLLNGSTGRPHGGFVPLKDIVGSALKPRTSSAMKQQALCKNWQGPNQSQTQRLSE